MLTRITPAPALKLFPTLTVPTRRDQEKLGEQLACIFLMKRSGEPMVVIDDHGHAHTRDSDSLDLMESHRRRHRPDDVTNEVIERTGL